MTDLPKAESLARALNNVMSGGRGFTSALAAQSRDELRRLSAENVKFEDALKAVETWWLEEGMSQMYGAPVCIFQVRAALKVTP